jgi:D-3-phosphoglycerate dehydrogenase
VRHAILVTGPVLTAEAADLAARRRARLVVSGPYARAADLAAPAPGDLLVAPPNVIATPHVGASTQAALDAMGVIAVNHILDALEGKSVDLRALVNAQQLRAA